MSGTVSRADVVAFYQAYSGRDLPAVAALLHEDVYWAVSGPVDVLRYCGERQGRDEVMRMIRDVIPQIFRERRFDPQHILIDGDAVAVLARLTGVQHDGRVISYRLAHFARFRDGKVTSLTSIIDSFNAVEQITGRAIPLQPRHAGEAAADIDDLIVL